MITKNYFRNPIDNSLITISELTKNTFTPVHIAHIMATNHYQVTSYARRAIIAAFIYPDLMSLLAEFPNVLYTLTDIYKQNKGISYPFMQFKEYICNNLLNCKYDNFLDLQVKITSAVDDYLASEYRHFFDWMDKDDDEMLYLKLYHQLSINKNTNTLKFRMEFI